MTTNASNLTESARALYDDFRWAGLSEADALTAARDGYASERAMKVGVHRKYSGLSDADARRHLVEAGQTAVARVKARDEARAPKPLTEASYDQRSAHVFDRPGR